MIKVGIITLYGLYNYGNRLQNYAMQQLISSLGVEAKTFNTHVYFFECYGKKYKLKKKIHEMTKYKFAKDTMGCMDNRRNYLFESFTKKYIPTEKIEDINKLDEMADYFVVGSDQVWNPFFYEDTSDWDMYLLTTVRPEKKLCFSPSFGIEKLKKEWEPQFINQLPTFQQLSVREKTGEEIIKSLTGCDSQVLLDPTMVVDINEWHKILKRPYGIDTKKPYILTYFLGERTECVLGDLDIINHNGEYNIYHLNEKKQPFLYATGPREFLYLIAHAAIVLTDSYHACIFSFIFNRPFEVYARKEDNQCSMWSRLETLLKKIKLERKIRNDKETIDWFENEYSDGWKVVNEEREKAINFLKNNICS